MHHELHGRKIAILVENMYEDQEFWYPNYRMREAGAEVTVVGTGTASYTSKHNYPAKADTSADRVRADDFDAVIIPGGYSPDLMRRSQAMVDFVRQAAQKGKVVAAICHGPWMLASAGAAKGKRITCWPSVKDDLVNAGARYEDAEVVVDGNIITSRMPQDLPAFCRAIVGTLRETGSGAEAGAEADAGAASGNLAAFPKTGG